MRTTSRTTSSAIPPSFAEVVVCGLPPSSTSSSHQSSVPPPTLLPPVTSSSHSSSSPSFESSAAAAFSSSSSSQTLPVSRQFNPSRDLPFDIPKFDRREPLEFFYIPVDCPHGKKCSDGACPLAHTKLEKIFHPIVYKTQPCQFIKAAADDGSSPLDEAGSCEYLLKCAFYHNSEDRLAAETAWRTWETKWDRWRKRVDQFLLEHGKADKETRRKVDGILKLRVTRSHNSSVNRPEGLGLSIASGGGLGGRRSERGGGRMESKRMSEGSSMKEPFRGAALRPTGSLDWPTGNRRVEQTDMYGGSDESYRTADLVKRQVSPFRSPLAMRRNSPRGGDNRSLLRSGFHLEDEGHMHGSRMDGEMRELGVCTQCEAYEKQIIDLLLRLESAQDDARSLRQMLSRRLSEQHAPPPPSPLEGGGHLTAGGSLFFTPLTYSSPSPTAASPIMTHLPPGFAPPPLAEPLPAPLVHASATPLLYGGGLPPPLQQQPTQEGSSVMFGRLRYKTAQEAPSCYTPSTAPASPCKAFVTGGPVEGDGPFVLTASSEQEGTSSSMEEGVSVDEAATYITHMLDEDSSSLHGSDKEGTAGDDSDGWGQLTTAPPTTASSSKRTSNNSAFEVPWADAFSWEGDRVLFGPGPSYGGGCGESPDHHRVTAASDGKQLLSLSTTASLDRARGSMEDVGAEAYDRVFADIRDV
eukprot:GHVS01048904.1.p1 GENE.GHVS01048904.1~~GHVS01048904.1.p1  ORF type:complete len:694 (+),score=192.52 GHVS01048904.1:89-2170(+)